MKLYYSPLSHFSRKIRILLAALGQDVALIDVCNVADMSTENFGQNPLMKVPTLVDGDITIFESDHIAQYLIQQYDPNDQFKVMIKAVQAMNARAVMNGIMSAEVELILAQRSGLDISGHVRYEKIQKSITQGLQWLDGNAQLFETPDCYLSFHLVAMWDHLLHYQLVKMDYHHLQYKVTKISELNCVKISAP